MNDGLDGHISGWTYGRVDLVHAEAGVQVREGGQRGADLTAASQLRSGGRVSKGLPKIRRGRYLR